MTRHTLESVDVHAWCLRTDAADAARDDDTVLSSHEVERRDRFRFANDRRDYAAAHALLRRSLSRYASVPPGEWRFETDASGKPYVQGRTLSFNLSHTAGLVACAIARALPVGVDVERAGRVKDPREIAERFFSPREAAAVEGQEIRFTEIWTLKEAFLKALGTGLAGSLRSCAFDLAPDQSRIGFEAPEGAHAGEWHFALYAPDPDTRMAVAVHSTEPVRWAAREVRGDETVVLAPLYTS